MSGRFPMQDLTCLICRFESALVLAPHLGRIRCRDGVIVFIQSKRQGVALPARRARLSQQRPWLTLAHIARQSLATVGEERVPVDDDLVKFRDEQVLGECALDQIVHGLGEVWVFAVGHLEIGAVRVQTRSGPPPAGDRRYAGLVPGEDVAPVEFLVKADQAVVEDIALFRVLAHGHV